MGATRERGIKELLSLVEVASTRNGSLEGLEGVLEV